MAGLTEFIQDQGLKIVSGVAIKAAGVTNPVGWGIMFANGVKAVLDGREEDLLKEASEKLKCSHISILPKGNTGPMNATADYFLKNKSGMRFKFGEAYLVHPFSGFDVRRISCSEVWRWDSKSNGYGLDVYYKGHVSTCPLCISNKAV